MEGRFARVRPGEDALVGVRLPDPDGEPEEIVGLVKLEKEPSRRGGGLDAIGSSDGRAGKGSIASSGSALISFCHGNVQVGKGRYLQRAWLKV